MIGFLANLYMHGGLLIAMYLEFIFNSIEFKWRHFIFIALIGIVYLGVNVAYTILTGNVIYPGMDFLSVLSYVFLSIAIILIFVHFFAGYFIYYKYKFPIIKKKYC